MTTDSATPVIAGVDGSPAGYRAATWAAGEAHARGRELMLLAHRGPKQRNCPPSRVCR
jgi:hypothetical protein